MRPELRINPGLAQWAVQALGRLLLTAMTIEGVLILQGGVERWMTPTYEFARRLPGAPESWGAVIVAVGAFGLAASLNGRNSVTAVCHMLASAWCSFFAVSVLLAAATFPNVSRIPMVNFTSLAVAFAVLGVIYWQSRSLTAGPIGRLVR